MKLTNTPMYTLYGWHKHCFTWQAEGKLDWYADLETRGELKLIQTAATSLTSAGINSGGTIILLHEQDTFGGEVEQSVPGKVALFNMWDYVLTETEIQELGCNDRGNVINWDTLRFMGQADIIYENFPCNDKESMPFLKSHQGDSQQMMFCKVEGSRIDADTVSTHTVKSAAQCIRICTSSSLCQSVNYDIQQEVVSCMMSQI
ncbi:NPTX2 [Bugula neritina]|uniref:NPTX2 n=1 Tax=Bugula neritina TaxID=10212 RepID=A0A7J7JG74_BUGNE|nr:NPTX2 [Bugula neritina]